MILAYNVARYLNKKITYLNPNLIWPLSNYQYKPYSNKSHRQQKSHSKFENTVKYDTNSKKTSLNKTVEKFEDEISLRRSQASKSILFKIDNESDLFNLEDDLEKIGSKVSNILVLNELNNTNSRAVLVEFSTLKNIDDILNNFGNHFANNDRLPCKTRLFIYRNQAKKFNQRILNKNYSIKNFKISEKDQINNPKVELKEKFSFLNSSQTLDHQIKMVYEKFKLDEIGIRIRFFIASLVEESFYSLFRNCLCLPFGSSAINFGHKTSDLDLLFSIDNTFFNTRLYDNNQLRLNGKMIFYSKYNKNEQERDVAKKFLELTKFILSNILPKFNVRQLIKGARVPILEFDFELPSGQKLNCDLSMSNIEASYQMTKLFWTFTKMDQRIAPLIFFLKYWAKITGVTNTFRPSPNITNFQLTVLILNFLLRLDKPLIVPLENLISYNEKWSDSELRYTINESINLSGIREFIKEKNEISLRELMMGFFNYYSNFDFDSNIISLSRQLNIKSDHFKHEALVILNPFMPEMNASKNVNRKLLKKFSFFCNQSYEYLQANDSINLVEFFEFLKKKSIAFNEEKNQTTALADEMNT